MCVLLLLLMMIDSVASPSNSTAYDTRGGGRAGAPHSNEEEDIDAGVGRHA